MASIEAMAITEAESVVVAEQEAVPEEGVHEGACLKCCSCGGEFQKARDGSLKKRKITPKCGEEGYVPKPSRAALKYVITNEPKQESVLKKVKLTFTKEDPSVVSLMVKKPSRPVRIFHMLTRKEIEELYIGTTYKLQFESLTDEFLEWLDENEVLTPDEKVAGFIVCDVVERLSGSYVSFTKDIYGKERRSCEIVLRPNHELGGWIWCIYT